jgi:hypothetical protein
METIQASVSAHHLSNLERSNLLSSMIPFDTQKNILPMKICNVRQLHVHVSNLASLAGLALLCMEASPANAAASITNSLTGFTGTSQTNFPAQPSTLTGSSLNVSFVWGGGDGAWEKIDFSASGATFGNHQGGANGRNYLRTDDVNYATDTVGFTAYVTVDRSTRESVFFGMGDGALGQFKQPDSNLGNASVFLDLQEGFDNASRRLIGGTVGSPTDAEVAYDGMTTVTGPMRLRMEYDGAADTVVYSIDYSPIGAFVADQTFAAVDLSSIAAEWAGGENSRIYFGSQGGVTFTDFSVTVIPEPAAALLGSLAFLGLLRRRR